MSAKTEHGLLVLDRPWRADEFTMVRGDLFASVRIGWCTNDSEGRWHWSVYRIVEGSPNKSIADGFDCAFGDAKAAAEAAMASTPDLAVYTFAGLESPQVAR